METIQKITFTEMENICKTYLKDSWDNNDLYKILISPKLTKTMIYFGTERIQTISNKGILIDALDHEKNYRFFLITYTTKYNLFNIEYFDSTGYHFITLTHLNTNEFIPILDNILFPRF